jgi:hypothetical protein
MAEMRRLRLKKAVVIAVLAQHLPRAVVVPAVLTIR